MAIGTHDLATIQGPFTYEALPPQEIRFVPLKQAREFRADELMEVGGWGACVGGSVRLCVRVRLFSLHVFRTGACVHVRVRVCS